MPDLAAPRDPTAPGDLAPGAVPHHRLRLHGRRGALTLALDLALTAPWTVLFGPSGCGKSTVLRAIAGLKEGLHVDLSRWERAGLAPIVLQNETQTTPPEDRQLAYAPQQALLFPHLTVRENVAFATTVRRHHVVRAAVDLITEAINLFQLEALLDRLPPTLSGGERQRVNLARALAVPHPRLMLLDEPFAGLDRALRDQLLPGLQATLRQRGIPVLSVTHDVDEVFLLAPHVIQLQEGKIVAEGSAQQVLHDEAARVLRALGPTSEPS